MNRENVIHTATIGSIRLPVRRYAKGRFGFDYTALSGDRVRVRVTAPNVAIQRAQELVERGVGNVDMARTDAALFAEFLQWKAKRIASAPVPKLVAAMLAARERKGITHATVRELKSTLIPFAKRFLGNIGDLTRKEVEEWMDEREPSPRRWNNMRAAIIALHRYARRDGLLTAELTPVETMDRRKVMVSVDTYSPEEIKTLLQVVPEEWAPLIIFGAFCGLRPEEIHPDTRNGGYKKGITWQNVNWGRGVVDIPATVSKDRRRRFATLTDAARDLLEPWRNAKGRITPDRDVYKPRLAWMEKAEGLGWKVDGLRHSYASYRLALTKDLQALSLEMGNSILMLHRHYVDLKHEPEAVEYFAIRRANLCHSPARKRRAA